MWIQMTATLIVHNPDKQRFEANLDGAGLARLEYRRRGQQIIYTHTEVSSASEGHGIASSLAKFALDYARDNNLEVVPMCKFVAAYIRQHPEYLPLVSPGHRSRVEKHPQ
jgi:predicted GNAT family acetyltransferase